ncbi:hypothetical protein TeGR_g6814, partial [Tetraparma gracilis]
MPSESKYDDDGPEESKEEGAEGEELAPLVTAFLEFSYGTDLQGKTEAFIADNAESAGFKDKTRMEESGEGHPLKWSSLHNEFVETVDKELTEFCEENNVDPRDLFEELEAAMTSSKDVADALPGFVKLTSYEHFCSQMESAATLSTFVEDAAERSAPSDDDPWSGEWHGLFNFDKKKRDQHLATLKVPWVLRKMVGVVMRKEGQVNGVVKYEPRKFLQRTFNFGMLGQQNETFIYSDEWENFNGGFGKAFLKTK